jgi:hypothetical protein
MYRYSHDGDGRGLAYWSGNKSTYSNYSIFPPVTKHCDDIYSHAVKSTHKPNIPCKLFKACLYVLCFDLIPLREVKSCDDFVVIPATSFADLDTSALLTLRHKETKHVKGSPVFTVNSPGVTRLILGRMYLCGRLPKCGDCLQDLLCREVDRIAGGIRNRRWQQKEELCRR